RRLFDLLHRVDRYRLALDDDGAVLLHGEARLAARDDDLVAHVDLEGFPDIALLVVADIGREILPDLHLTVGADCQLLILADVRGAVATDRGRPIRADAVREASSECLGDRKSVV